MITLKDVRENPEVDALIRGAQKQLNALGYTEHGHRHISIVSKRAGDILEKLGYPERTVELTRIAGYMHDIGNCINRVDHAHSGAILAYDILKNMRMPVDERTEIMMAIGNHDENTGSAISDISAAIILADKSDVHRDRVVNKNLSTFDIHDRVNYSVKKSSIKINGDKTLLKLKLEIDTKVSSVVNYFEIFLNRMVLCRKACEKLGLEFKLIINEQQLM